jgi:hypothetical protein
MRFLRILANATTSSATAGSDVTTSSFVTGALCEHSLALGKGNEVVYGEALHVYATAGGTVAGRTSPLLCCLLSMLNGYWVVRSCMMRVVDPVFACVALVVPRGSL